MPASKFREGLRRKLAAGFQAFNLSTLEPGRALDELALYGREAGMPVVSWSSISGFRLLCEGGEADAPHRDKLLATCGPDPDNAANCLGDPHAALARMGDVGLAVEGATPPRCLVVMIDAHAPFADYPQLRTLFTDFYCRNQFVTTVEHGGRTLTVDHPIVFMHPTAGLHAEVDHLLEPLPLTLMGPEEIDATCVEYIRQSLGGGASGLEGEGGAALRRELAGACSGLLAHQINDVLALAARDGARLGFDRSSLGVVRKYRAALINQTGLVKVYPGGETFQDVGGLGGLKRYVQAMLAPRADALARPRGVLLLGVPGTGKSLITCALGNETGRTTLELNVGALMGGHVGESERNIRRALDIVDNSGAAILRVDEVEKALGGVESSDRSDGGALMRVFDEFLRWLGDHSSDVYTIMTSNDLSKLPPEFTRAGRFDSLWYMDLPNAQTKRALWKMYIAKYRLDPGQALPADDDFTGAEIASVARQAHLLGGTLAEAAENVTPVARRAAAKISAMRDWAVEAGCLDAERGGRYRRRDRPAEAPAVTQKGRKIDADG